MMTAMCRGSREKSSFSRRWGSSGVTGPGDSGWGRFGDTVFGESSLRRKVNIEIGARATWGAGKDKTETQGKNPPLQRRRAITLASFEAQDEGGRRAW